MPAYVDIVPLAFVHISPSLDLVFDDWVPYKDNLQVVKNWVKIVQANKTRVVFSIGSPQLASITGNDLQTFTNNVVNRVKEWGVDGIDFDYEPPEFDSGKGKNLVALIASIRAALVSVVVPAPLITLPFYSLWLSSEGSTTLKALVPYVDYFTTMDYTDYDSTVSLAIQYAQYVPWKQLVLGVCNMVADAAMKWTDLDDVVSLAKYNNTAGDKAGLMLYTFNYDRRIRKSGTNEGGGTGYSNLAWTEAITANLP